MSILIPVVILSAMGVVFGVALAIASKAFAVEKDGRIALVREVLPGANCAACGYTGCDGYAEAVVAGGAAPNRCTVGGPAVAAQIGRILGVEVGAVEKLVARVKCAGSVELCQTKYDYDGIQDCAAAALMHAGPSGCSFGCVGLGSCVRACDYAAIYVEDGLARVVDSRCAACGKCVAACPKKIIALVPASATYTVHCMNKERGAVARKNCGVACIGCMRCMRACKTGAIKVENNLASIDPALCTRCGECMGVCPQKCIQFNECVLNTPAQGREMAAV